ncbi:hypothetical protein DPQ22_01550 [Candidatus Tokpelaia sp.]|nr:hypothetical protein DPQ22_01550 [Candidatus Tokpelaia sp.]
MWLLYAGRNFVLLYTAGRHNTFTFACALRQAHYKYAVSGFYYPAKLPDISSALLLLSSIFSPAPPDFCHVLPAA